MTKEKRNIILCSIISVLAIVFTILVKFIDVQAIGPNDSVVGFATINSFLFKLFGVNMIFYHITDWVGIIPIVMAIAYIVIGFVQLIKRKSIKKVDKEIFILGAFYIILIALYIFFEKVIINYRPVLIEGYLEASYPSSHTLMAMCLCGSTVLINRKLFNNKFAKVINIVSIVIMIVTVIGRLISGVHWFTDIVGGLLISSALLMIFNMLIKLVKKKENK